MKTISVFGVFVADLCFISNAIPEKGQTILGSQHIIGPAGPIICCEPRIVCPFSGIALDMKQRSATNTPKTEIVFIF